MARFLALRYGKVTRSVDAPDKFTAMTLLRLLDGERCVSEASWNLDADTPALPRIPPPDPKPDTNAGEAQKKWRGTLRAAQYGMTWEDWRQLSVGERRKMGVARANAERGEELRLSRARGQIQRGIRQRRAKQDDDRKEA